MLDSEIVWRVEAMQQDMVRGRSACFLYARATPTEEGRCWSCNEPLSDNEQARGIRCDYCIEAANIVVNGGKTSEYK